MRGSWRYSLIFFVYSSSFGCAVLCASATGAVASSNSAGAAAAKTNRRTGRIRRDMSFLLMSWSIGRVARPGADSLTYAQRHLCASHQRQLTTLLPPDWSKQCKSYVILEAVRLRGA